jgi:predicted XRE-type DNA-binding protein
MKTAKLQKLLAQLSPEEKAGQILKVKVPKGTLPTTRKPQTMIEEVQEAIAAKAMAEALTRVRKQAGLRAKDVAAELEVSAPRIAQMESEGTNLTLGSLVEYARAVDCEVEVVLRPRNPKLPMVVAPISMKKR